MSKYKDEALEEARAFKSKIREEKRIRLLKFAKENPGIPRKQMAKLFDVGHSSVDRWLRGED